MAALARRPYWKLCLHVAHVHHHVRPEAGDDAAVVAATADSLNIPFHMCHVYPSREKGNLAASARRLRYSVLADVARSTGSEAIVTAHHGDDLLETMLLRLERGAGMAAFAPMRWRSRMNGTLLLRPLLDQTHCDLTTLLHSIGWTWREDASNVDTRRQRARLRKSLAEIWPPDRRARLARRVHRTADLASSARSLMRKRALTAYRRALKPCCDSDTQVLNRAKLRPLDPSILGELLRLAFAQLSQANCGMIRHRTLQSAVDLIRATPLRRGVIEFPSKLRLHVAPETVTLVRAPSESIEK